MTNANQPKPVVLERIEDVGPAVPALEALRRNLLYRMLGAVSGDDIAHVVKAQVEKAKAGDSKAARLMIDMIQAGTPNVTVNNDNRGSLFLSDVRVQLVHVLRAEGPMRPMQLAERLLLTQDVVCHALADSDWFEKRGPKWKLSAKAATVGE